MNAVREAIEKLTNEIKKINVTNGFYQQTIFNTYQKNYNQQGNHENNYEDDFDEYL